MPADLGGIARGPGTFHERATGMGLAGFGDGALAALLSAGVFRGDETQELHEWSGIVKAGEVPEFGDGGHGYGELPATQGLEGLDHRLQAPGFHLLVEFLFEPLESLCRLGDRPDICLKDHVLRGGGTDHLSEPPEVGWAPAGPACIADIVSEQKGLESELGSLEVSPRIFAGAGEIANGLIFDRGNVDGGEITRAQQARQLDRIAPVGVDAVAGLLGNQ